MLKYVSGNPQNAGFCTIYPTARPPVCRPKFVCLGSLAVLHLLFQNSLLLLKVLKALIFIGICFVGASCFICYMYLVTYE